MSVQWKSMAQAAAVAGAAAIVGIAPIAMKAQAPPARCAGAAAAEAGGGPLPSAVSCLRRSTPTRTAR